ncbi:hypothetical protein SOQ14_07285 [Erythrobacter sp. T5W1-R]|uniref:hypothetical protein n=1 Tax=Erythrobacter sp. T5W1-R TaxID=3101752 RepID=UPI002AFEE496|nr:hypothetical protein [Erythrobacter sp. T5W1-R]MEA1618717.1 hypothetical protein [Erythrobacter sp. T5W1-R]
MKALITAASTAAGAALLTISPAAAQGPAGERINMVIAYSEDECPVAKQGEIVVCEILVEAERYRIPSNLRFSDSPENTAWSRRVDKIRYVGDFGTMSCSPAGAGGITGCTQRFIDDWAKDKSEAESVRFGQLIEKARQERLSEIDESAAAEQARVEMIEREYMERLERERAGELPGEAGKPGPDAAPLPPIAPPAPQATPSPDE